MGKSSINGQFSIAMSRCREGREHCMSHRLSQCVYNYDIFCTYIPCHAMPYHYIMLHTMILHTFTLHIIVYTLYITLQHYITFPYITVTHIGSQDGGEKISWCQVSSRFWCSRLTWHGIRRKKASWCLSGMFEAAKHARNKDWSTISTFTEIATSVWWKGLAPILVGTAVLIQPGAVWWCQDRRSWPGDTAWGTWNLRRYIYIYIHIYMCIYYICLWVMA